MNQPGQSAAMDESARVNPRLRAAGIAISVASLAGVVVWASQQEAPSLPSGADEWLALVVAVLVYAAATALRGERWWWLLTDSSVNASRTDSYCLTAVGYMGNNVLPARGGDALRTLLMTRRTTGTARTIVGTLITERILDVVFLLALFVVVGYGVLSSVAKPDTGILIAVGIAALVVGAATFAAFKLYSDRPAIKRVSEWIAPVLHPTRRLHGRHAGLMAGQTTGIWLLEIATYVAVGYSVGIELQVIEAAYIIAVSSIFVLIPSGPGYVGTLDAAILFGLGAIGTSGAAAVSYLLMARFVLLVPVTIAGFLILVTRYRGTRALGPERAA